MPPSIDEEIDGLYQLPLDEFTAARNSLAKDRGSRAAEIRRLQKPKPAAWAINQVYWRQRALFERLVKASTELRRGHVAKIGGKAADVRALEARHQAALDAVRQKVIELLNQAGGSSPTTLAAVDRTLLAIPAPGVAGRLTEPIESVGFGLLSGLLDTSAASRGLADVVSIGRRGTKSTSSDEPAAGGKAGGQQAERQAKAEEEARRKERARLVKELAASTAAEKTTKGAFLKAKQGVADAEAEIEQLEASLRRARADADDRRARVERLRSEANDAAALRVARERALQLLGD